MGVAPVEEQPRQRGHEEVQGVGEGQPIEVGEAEVGDKGVGACGVSMVRTVRRPGAGR